MPSARIPATATYRRREGLTFTFDLCAGIDPVDVKIQHHWGTERTTLSLAEVALLGRMSRWQNASELGVTNARLDQLVKRHMVLWSDGRPRRDLTCAPLSSLDGRVALRRNAVPKQLMARGDQLCNPPFMPRVGELAELVAVGMDFVVMEMGVDTHTAAFWCCNDHGALLRALVPSLDGRHDIEELAVTPGVRPILEALEALGMLERHQPPEWDGTPQVTWLGHAGVLYEAGGKRILVDPSDYPCSLPSRDPVLPPDPRNLGKIDAVLITHGDNDHLHPGALARLPTETLVIIPRVSDPQPYHVDMAGMLRLLGFRRIVEVAEWETVELDAVRVVAAPFRGEDWGLSLPCRSYLIECDALSVYLNADAAFMPDVYQRLAEQHAIDVAFLGVSGAAEAHVQPPRYGYGHFYQPWIPPARASQWVELCSGPEEAAEAARLLRARFAVGYAAGGASYHALAYCDRGTHAELARLLEASGASVPLDLSIGVPASIPRQDRRRAH